MKSDPSPDDGAPSPHGATGPDPGWSNRDHAALPARRLGPKALAVHARRLQRSTTAGTAAPDPGTANNSGPGVRLTTADAAVSFTLRTLGHELLVERTQRRPLGTHLMQAMLFSALADFLRWCDAEPLRFEEPLLHQHLQRHGEECFGGQR